MATKVAQAVEISHPKIAMVQKKAKEFGFASAVTGSCYFGPLHASKHHVATGLENAAVFAFGGVATIAFSFGGALTDLWSVGAGTGVAYAQAAGPNQAASAVVKKEYRTRSALLDAVCSLLDQESGLDELDIADRLGVNLKTAALACDELINQNRIAPA